MKVATSAAAQQQNIKINKRPQLALDVAFKTGSSGIQVYVERPGHGAKAQDDSHIKVHYEGWLSKDFTLFDSSRAKLRPFEFDLGKGSVIDGWEIALKGVRQGTKMQIKIPAKLAYGSQGAASMGIPPNADLIFKVEVLKVT
ncbi:MAG TPA: FKBP-type peptidyl-prolyl cis-trans isomerase [Candidatus Lambdaproteobacteria bacterium]|jgi:FKBP-type peptidyl-prolyl cis-trans isomerase|nr:FKBP-type peptidyl-prolyl cis-trans isomerase [SAR324 cluster bacterium]HHZ77683.1 FKBP-type peptidyl-prolyl cis-trans isomerase [Candidatus Lambdaproteobacteria bacterium]HIN47066.1 FKBP-type peptidyl-prolyl cis-trans isomerase [Deltaproteobacteria bacterium]HIA56597.1 FKBP-type peptidyl-prolyl cis-trans isomerase [Candidatus Lambdaproteobacteria bacterium]HIB45316.1 FKBP-type peptidyl-prolyl cis-trans isomerase [Candidatus Lambdaproteobacteria bacterium]